MQPNNLPPPGPVTASQAKKGKGIFIVIIILLVILLLGAISFGIYAYTDSVDNKKNVDAKVAAAVAEARQKVSDEKDNEFAEEMKNPLKNYTGPSQLGSVSIQYPKNWSAYVSEKTSGATPLDAYFHPDFVRATDSGTSDALRLSIVESSLDSELEKFSAKVKNGKVRISPFRAREVPGVLGSRIDGEIATGISGSMVLLPVRDKTLILYTEAEQFVKDFDSLILPNLTFSP